MSTTSTIREALTKARTHVESDRMEAVVHDRSAWADLAAEALRSINQALAALADMERAAGEPVAWASKGQIEGLDSVGDMMVSSEMDMTFQDPYDIPLYTHPPTPSEPRITVAQARDGWISVKDRLPERNTPVLAAGKNSVGVKWIDIGIWDGHWSFCDEGETQSSETPPTHWMTPPKHPNP